MGCDIHMVLERKVMVRDKPVWVGINAFPYVNGTIYDFDGKTQEDRTKSGHIHWDVRARNYSLFAQLAGVRGEGPKPRGVPDDASDLSLMEIDHWGEDGHSHSWGLMSEVLPCFIQCGQFGDPGRGVLHALKKGTAHALDEYMAHFWMLNGDENLEDFRLVYWFDN